MANLKKHFFSILAVAIFFILAIGSSAEKLTYQFRIGSYGYQGDTTEKRNFLLKNDGSKIYGENIKKIYHPGFSKTDISIDNQTFPTSEIKGYQEANIFYLRYKGYVKRIIHGKLNVYEMTLEEVRGTTGNLTSFTKYKYFMQRGEDEKLQRIKNSEDVRKAVKDCPEALAKLDMPYDELQKKVRASSYFLSEVIRAYNQCK